ncbi:MAG: 1-(5-phosphoribosyl)-5-[(5-phosphoribosylamino)methylideneamino]imidazole-4-carboxamide isomerase [Methanomicrobiaceae archaeon]|nr:1-(5-phosphoribosyl)-5-[(5-phosphoribosylamino)methylideneamino]imidazole-4-carboxamide isomerase [Methanomicrobiaceae archaeon]
MEIFPAVDILGGRCVQLVQGVREDARFYGDPLACATRWTDEGATALHIINLDGAFGSARENAEQICRIVSETGVFVQLGGGIRSAEDAAAWLDLGVDRVILGTLAIRHPESIREIAEEHGSSSVMAGVDARGGEIVVEGWTERAGDYLHWAERFEHLGAGSLLFTNVDVEGLEQGIDPEPVRRLVAHTRLPVVAAGGITCIDDITALRGMGAAGAVLGSALYSGKIALCEALEAIR